MTVPRVYPEASVSKMNFLVQSGAHKMGVKMQICFKCRKALFLTSVHRHCSFFFVRSFNGWAILEKEGMKD